MRPVRRALGAVVAASTVSVFTFLASPAHAVVLACGSTITANTTLTADVGPCAADGVIIGASNITLDLNGHRVFGTSGPTSVLDAGVGVKLTGFNNVTVTSGVAGGKIDHFDAGVAIDGSLAAASGNTVSNLTIRDNFSESPTGGDFGDGVTMFGSGADNNTVQNNSIINNGPFSGVSAFNGTSANKITGLLITGNTILDNRTQSSQTAGIRLENWTWSSTISNNTIKRSAFDGISLFADTESNTITGNTVRDNGASGDPSHRPGDGIHGFARVASDTISNNVVKDNAGSGIALDSGAGNNTVSNNTALNNDTNPLILIEVPPVLTVKVTARVSAVIGGMPILIPPASGNFDLKDGNTVPPCGTNTWTTNTYGTRNQTCIS